MYRSWTDGDDAAPAALASHPVPPTPRAAPHHPSRDAHAHPHLPRFLHTVGLALVRTALSWQRRWRGA